MPKSKDGLGWSDGRKHNAPPEHSKIKPNEVRNKWGRAGKPKPQPTSSMDELIWEEACRIVSHDSNGPVNAKKRLVQEEFLSALKHCGSTVRARLLAKLGEVSERIEQQRIEIHGFFVEGKFMLGEQFDLAQKLGESAPDILPHPDHVEIRGDQVYFRGPTDRRGRPTWEMTKTAIRVAACLHEIARDEFRRTGSPAVHADLKAIERHRRWLMRSVPKGWDWREEIYCRDSGLSFAKETVRELKEFGYVPSDTDNCASSSGEMCAAFAASAV